MTAILYAITDGTHLTKLGTYDADTAVRLSHDPSIIKHYGPLVAISTHDGSVLDQYMVTVFKANGYVHVVEHFYSLERAEYYQTMMQYKGYCTTLRRV